MKNNYQIGDWVYINGLPAQVFELAYNHNEKEMTIGILDPQGEIYSAFYGYDHIEPIPLTEEILEKNFEKHPIGDYAYYSLCAGFGDISISAHTDGAWEVSVDDMDDEKTWTMYVSNVHQLQQALRLAGNDKEIEI